MMNAKLSSNLRACVEKRNHERKRNILHLIHGYLMENCLENSAETLFKEANLSETIEVCDNIDLDTILQEYNSFYYAKFNKWPRICKITSKPKEEEEIGTKKKKTNSKSKLIEESDPIQPVGDEFEIIVRQFEQIQIPNPIPIPIPGLIKFDDCIGLDPAVNLLKESAIYPKLYPELFRKICPWSGILLYGPPGTGKTLLAKALTSESGITLLNVTPSGFISKWRGDSEKNLKSVFDLARSAPSSVVFIDELDALASRRDELQHEASRRFKSELLTQLDGIDSDSGSGSSGVLVLAISNLPWEIDPAILRRFEQKIFIDLPNEQARIRILEKYLGMKIGNAEIDTFVRKTEGFSGNDLRIVCKMAFMRSVRAKLNESKKNGNGNGSWNCEPSLSDVQIALDQTTPAAIYCRQKYIDWKIKFGGNLGI